jgi:hypothetical protein
MKIILEKLADQRLENREWTAPALANVAFG